MLAGAAFAGYLFQYWLIHTGLWGRMTHEVSSLRFERSGHGLRPYPSGSGGEEAATPYLTKFDKFLALLMADRSARLIAYEYPVEALRYQQARAGAPWRLLAHLPILAGLAVPRQYQSFLDSEGIIYIDPTKAPVAALENKGTPLKVDQLQRYFLLVPDLSVGHRWSYQVVPIRLLGSREAGHPFR
jgi:hypothetical protein